MPYAFYRDNQYCVSNTAQEAFEGRGSLVSTIPRNMRDVKVITSFNQTTGQFKYRQATAP